MLLLAQFQAKVALLPAQGLALPVQRLAMLAQWGLAQVVWPLGLVLAVVAAVALEQEAVVVAVLLLWVRLVCLVRQVGLLLRAQQEAA